VDYKCDTIELVLNQPVFLKPKITDRGRVGKQEIYEGWAIPDKRLYV